MFRCSMFCCLAYVMAILVVSVSNAQVPPPTVDPPVLAKRAEASPRTEAVHDRFKRYLPFDRDQQDFADAQRGLLEPLDPLVIKSDHCVGEKCTTIWDMTLYEFLNPFVMEDEPPAEPYPASAFPDAPYTANPSLWRNAVLNTIHGVFEVVKDEIYQVRGYDLSNMSAIRGETGWIIVDPLTTKETAGEALRNLNRAYVNETGENAPPVAAVIFTHSHVDHFGGIFGLADGGEVKDDLRIYAPERFLEEAVSENVIVGNAMGRRATYMYGPLLERGPKGQIDGGLGKSTPAGTTGIAEPDCVIRTGGFDGDCGNPGDWSTSGELVIGKIDGVDVQFQNVPGSEAPAEIIFYFPGLQALCASEDVTHTFHNVLTLRGANVRDSLLWSKYLHKSLEYFEDAEVIFASHHWPTWNKNPDLSDVDPEVPDRVAEIIEQQRDLYRYIHDQSVRLTNKGYTIQEVGERVKLPRSLGQRWFNRGYYGTVNHNAKAVYQRYIGWFDGNPASLHQLPPALAAREYVRYMGGPEAVLEKARDDFDRGLYRWVAMVLSHVVFSQPSEAPGLLVEDPIYDPVREARKLLADTYDQLAYQAESGPWRNFYLTGAMELRNGVLPLPAVKTFTRDTVEAMDLEMIYDFLAVHLKGLEAGDRDYTFEIVFWEDEPSEEDQRPSVWYVKNGVLNYDIDKRVAGRTATLRLTRSFLDDLVMGESRDGQPITRDDLICAEVTAGSPESASCIVVSGPDGARDKVEDFFGLLDTFEFWFDIVTP